MPYIATHDGEFHYDVADYTDPWLEEKDTLIMHHGFCRNGDVPRTPNLTIEIR